MPRNPSTTQRPMPYTPCCDRPAGRVCKFHQTHERCAVCNGIIERPTAQDSWEHDVTDQDWQQWEQYAMRQHDAEPDYSPTW